MAVISVPIPHGLVRSSKVHTDARPSYVPPTKELLFVSTCQRQTKGKVMLKYLLPCRPVAQNAAVAVPSAAATSEKKLPTPPPYPVNIFAGECCQQDIDDNVYDLPDNV